MEYIPQLLEKVVAVDHTPQILQHSLYCPPKGWWTNNNNNIFLKENIYTQFYYDSRIVRFIK